MRAVKFPSQGTVFDYYIDPDTKKFTPWRERTPPYELEPDVPLQVWPTHTVNTINHNYTAKHLLCPVCVLYLVRSISCQYDMVNSKLLSVSEALLS